MNNFRTWLVGCRNLFLLLWATIFFEKIWIFLPARPSRSTILTGKDGRLKSGKLLNLIGRVGSKTRKFHYHDIQGAQIFQTPGVFLTHPV